jgi:aspartyl-tRNA(Asn)/glutamyl-tRNA(Gln) amidotransferase subunit A
MRLNGLGLKELVTMVKGGDVSPHDVANDLFFAVDEIEPRIRAYLEFYAEDMLTETRRMSDSGSFKRGRFAGIPIAVKDNIVTRGKRSTCGSRMLAAYVSPYDATVIERLRSEGAVVAGKTNLDEFGMGSSTENSAFGPTRNPWNLDHVPGGSSGGSAAAVAAGIAVAALGSDTGGSIRQPASFCGVVGVKPTYGRVSRYGLVAFASSFDQIGPITKNVADAAFLLSAMCGRDRRDATTVDLEAPNFEADLDKGCDGLRVGIPWDLLKSGLDPSIDANFKSIVERLEREGIEVIDVALPASGEAVACYYTLANAEASSNLARYDGVRYGHRTGGCDDVAALYTRSRDEGFGEEVKRRILLGTYVLSAGYYDAYYLQAQKVRSLVVDDFKKAFEKCDVIALPTTPTPAFRFGEKSGDPLSMYLSDVFTIPANLAGLPALSMPCGVSDEGLPLGLQLVAKAFDETTMLRCGAGLERMIDFKEKAIV